MTESFLKTGDFFATSGVSRTDSFRLKRRVWSLLNTSLWSVIVLLPMLYYLIKLLLSGSTIYFSIGVGIIIICESIIEIFTMRQFINLTAVTNHFSFLIDAQNDWNVKNQQKFVVWNGRNEKISVKQRLILSQRQ